MFEKSFITDCEGPLTLNDNAYELANNFIEDGGNLFKILSLYDDYLVDIVKKENYKAGNTLKLILPFFVVENLKNKDFIDFSKNNIYAVSDSKYLISYLKEAFNTYIVSTSYGQYIEAVSEYMELPFKNTFYTNVDVDALDLTDVEIEKIREYKKLILENPDNYSLFDDIFFNKLTKFNFYDKIKNIEVVGGEGKKLAIDKIIERDNINIGEILYIGDSITDVEPLQFARENEGISISFNGNEYPLNVAEIAVISDHTIVSSILIDLHSRFDKDYVLDFIRTYSEKGPDDAFADFEVDYSLIEEFEKVFHNKNAPIIEIITDENRDYLLRLSKEMRNGIRGKDIGGLG